MTTQEEAARMAREHAENAANFIRDGMYEEANAELLCALRELYELTDSECPHSVCEDYERAAFEVYQQERD